MKKLLLIALVLLSCEKKEPEINDGIDFPLLVSLLNKTVDQVKASFNFPVISESASVGNSTIKYKYAPGTIEFTAEVYFVNGIAKEVAIYFTDTDYNNAIRTTKFLSDKMNSLYSGKPYNAVFMPGGSFVTFNNRTEYWNYVDANPVTFAISESWEIDLVDVNLWYNKNENKIIVDISIP